MGSGTGTGTSGAGAGSSGTRVGSSSISTSGVTRGEQDALRERAVCDRRSRVGGGPRSWLLALAPVEFLAVCFVRAMLGS